MSTTTEATTARGSSSSDLLGRRWSVGKVFRCYSDKFGTHDLLCVKCPGTGKEARIRFMEILPSGESCELLYHSSAENDRVEREWANLLEYYAEVLA